MTTADNSEDVGDLKGELKLKNLELTHEDARILHQLNKALGKCSPNVKLALGCNPWLMERGFSKQPDLFAHKELEIILLDRDEGDKFARET